MCDYIFHIFPSGHIIVSNRAEKLQHIPLDFLFILFKKYRDRNKEANFSKYFLLSKQIFELSFYARKENKAGLLYLPSFPQHPTRQYQVLMLESPKK